MKKLLLILCAFIVLNIVTTPTAQALHTSYAVIFSGGINTGNNHVRYYEETLRMWQIMTGTLSFDVNNVYVLAADGTDTAVDQSDGVTSSDWSMITDAGGHIMSGTPENLQNTLALLSDLMTTEDSFDFWSFDHGGNTTFDPDATTYPYGSTEDEGYLCGWGGNITDDAFAAWVDPINIMAESYAFGQCFAGDMADDLMALSLGAGQYRFTAWAADWYEPSWGRSWVDAWADALEVGYRATWDLGYQAWLNDASRDTGAGGEHPGWAGDNFDYVTNQPIPEPSTLVLLGTGLSGFIFIKRKLKK